MHGLDTFTYFPGSDDEESVVFYKGISDKNFIYGGSPYDNKWFRVSQEGEQAFLEILAKEGVTFEGDPSWIQRPNNIRWLGYGGLLVIASTILILVYRRRFSNQPPV